VGLSIQWNGTYYQYTLTNSSMLVSNYTLVLTVQQYQSILGIRVCTINYELLQLPAGEYFDMLSATSSLSGTVPDSTSLLVADDFSIILGGLVDFTFNQSNTTVQFHITLAKASFLVQNYQSCQTSYFWLRMLICPQSYYINLTNSQCVACYYSCATCNNSNLASQCLTCSSSNYRTYNNGYCLCQTNYLDISGIASCSYAICDSTCLTCSNLDICGSCDATLHRTLVNQECPCSNRYYDDSPNLPCLACNYSCLTCTNNTACVTCSNTTDFRVLL
jgi:hypothetical protein